MELCLSCTNPSKNKPNRSCQWHCETGTEIWNCFIVPTEEIGWGFYYCWGNSNKNSKTNFQKSFYHNRVARKKIFFKVRENSGNSVKSQGKPLDVEKSEIILRIFYCLAAGNPVIRCTGILYQWLSLIEVWLPKVNPKVGIMFPSKPRKSWGHMWYHSTLMVFLPMSLGSPIATKTSGLTVRFCGVGGPQAMYFTYGKPWLKLTAQWIPWF